ncbi:MAG: MarR family transcriptional regulator, partial [Actinomycetota bacterium]|nr:MarR family transcriptional regulator [Actinomycetota bacterium]
MAEVATVQVGAENVEEHELAGTDRGASDVDVGTDPACRDAVRADQRGAVVQRELAEALQCTPRHITGLVDRLEAQGFVAVTDRVLDRIGRPALLDRP